jgi:hypothetical protein
LFYFADALIEFPELPPSLKQLFLMQFSNGLPVSPELIEIARMAAHHEDLTTSHAELSILRGRICSGFSNRHGTAVISALLTPQKKR